MSLESKLDNGDVVEVFTSKAENAGPSRDWLTFAVSPRARNKIKSWFSKERREEAVEIGKDQLSRAMRKQGLPIQRLMTTTSLVPIAQDLRYADITALYAAIGEGRLSAAAVVTRIVQAVGGEEGAIEDMAEDATPDKVAPRRTRGALDPGIVVAGMEDIWVKLCPLLHTCPRGRDRRVYYARFRGVRSQGILCQRPGTQRGRDPYGRG